ncbi:MAG: hypothetical protein DRR19_18490 [Candidatus Parabeggiatoa sp. nov. 1]|nr:MAG: hypothetical protein DRR19_18490 [Gammaproteobacteria bacterium]
MPQKCKSDSITKYFKIKGLQFFSVHRYSLFTIRIREIGKGIKNVKGNRFFQKIGFITMLNEVCG